MTLPRSSPRQLRLDLASQRKIDDAVERNVRRNLRVFFYIVDHRLEYRLLDVAVGIDHFLDDSVAVGDDLIEVLQQIGRRMKIDLVAPVPEKEKITAEFDKLPLEDAIKRLTPKYSHAMISEPGGKRISKIIVLQKGGETARPVPAAKALEIKRPETVARPTPSVKPEIVKEKAPVEPQPSFKFEFDPAQVEKRK